MSERCSQEVHTRGRWPRFHRCDRPGKVEHEGKWYCAQHDPAKRKAIRDNQDRRYNAEREYRAARANLLLVAQSIAGEAQGPLATAVNRYKASLQACADAKLDMWKFY